MPTEIGCEFFASKATYFDYTSFLAAAYTQTFDFKPPLDALCFPATINSAEEQAAFEAVLNTVGTVGQYFFIGLIKTSNQGVQNTPPGDEGQGWGWVDGSDFTYLNWRATYPNAPNTPATGGAVQILAGSPPTAPWIDSYLNEKNFPGVFKCCASTTGDVVNGLFDFPPTIPP